MKPNTKVEKAMWNKCYKIGRQNGWCSGKYARMDGDFISDDDCLNKDSASVVKELPELKKFFKQGNWCLGQAIMYKSLCFMQQVNGGDEWLTMKLFSDGIVRSFESITFEPMANDYEPKESYSCYTKDETFEEYVARLLEARVVKSKTTGNEIVIYGKEEIEEYKDQEPIAQ